MNDFSVCSICRVILREEILYQWHFSHLRVYMNRVLCGERLVPNRHSHTVFYIITIMTTLDLASHNFFFASDLNFISDPK
jgi:hypothetical protein